jgi:hypothetical protein
MDVKIQQHVNMSCLQRRHCKSNKIQAGQQRAGKEEQWIEQETEISWHTL